MRASLLPTRQPARPPTPAPPQGQHPSRGVGRVPALDRCQPAHAPAAGGWGGAATGLGRGGAQAGVRGQAGRAGRAATKPAAAASGFRSAPWQRGSPSTPAPPPPPPHRRHPARPPPLTVFSTRSSLCGAGLCGWCPSAPSSSAAGSRWAWTSPRGSDWRPACPKSCPGAPPAGAATSERARAGPSGCAHQGRLEGGGPAGMERSGQPTTLIRAPGCRQARVAPALCLQLHSSQSAPGAVRQAKAWPWGLGLCPPPCLLHLPVMTLIG